MLESLYSFPGFNQEARAMGDVPITFCVGLDAFFFRSNMLTTMVESNQSGQAFIVRA